MMIFLIMCMALVLPLINVNATDNTAEVENADELIAAVNDLTKTTIHLNADMDLTGKGVLNIGGRTLDLGGHTISANNFSLIFEGSDMTIKNGAFDSNGGAYGLFIGDMGDSDHVVVEDVTMRGGINVFNATNVVLKNVSISGMDYYAVWCDENAHVTIESGNYTSLGVAVIGMSLTETDLFIEGGTFEGKGKPLVLAQNDADGNPRWGSPIISGGTYDTSVDTKYLAEGFEPITDENGNVIVCDHSQSEIRNAKAPTCTQEGYTGDVYCKKCNTLLQSGATIPANGHHFDTLWHHDESKHWHECACKEKSDVAAHTFVWIIDKEATTQEAGSKHEECTICGYQKAAVEIAVKVDDQPTIEDPDKPNGEPAKQPDSADQNKPAEKDSVIANTSKSAKAMQSVIWMGLSALTGIVFISLRTATKRKHKS